MVLETFVGSKFDMSQRFKNNRFIMQTGKSYCVNGVEYACIFDIRGSKSSIPCGLDIKRKIVLLGATHITSLA